MNPPHVVCVSADDRSLYRFRLPLLRAIQAKGWRATAVAPAGEYLPRFESAGVESREWRLNRRSLNPLMEVKSQVNLAGTIRSLRPDLVHSLTLKGNIYGTLAARIAGVPRVVATVTGLGSYFAGVRRTPARCAIASLLRLSIPLADVTLFQNRADWNEMRGMGVSARRPGIAGSVGVDLDRFSPERFDQNDRSSRLRGYEIAGNPVVVTMASRLLWDKGVREFCVAAGQIRRSLGNQVAFVLAGTPDLGNPNPVSPEYIKSVARSGDVSCVGWVDDIASLLAVTDIFVLPSYREGASVSLQEAQAMGLPVVVSDVPGCRELVKDREDGSLVPPRNPAALAQAIRELVEDPDRRRSMGVAARDKAVRNYDVRAASDRQIRLYQELIQS